ncbi:MAG TPA: hypothetical protein VE076_01960 [Nitrososphaeraceae archaeon]|nr:hypothetical protein [Nitrososphaeraceae archaeon]
MILSNNTTVSGATSANAHSSSSSKPKQAKVAVINKFANVEE